MWSSFPPDPRPIEAGPEGQPSAAAAPPVSRPSRLLPVVQCVAEGGLLAVVAAAIQALAGQLPVIGPLEFAVAVGIGMGWARRTRWRGPVAEAFGLPILAVAAGAACWIVSVDVRLALLSGDLGQALAAHPAGWLGAVAVLRGNAHRSRDDDEALQDELMLWGLPVLGVAWLVGHLGAVRADADVLDAFTTVAFLGALFFVGAGVLALGLARLAGVRGEGAGGGSWFGFVLVVTGVMVVVGLVAGAALGVPLSALAVALLAPIRIIGAVFVLLLSPVIALAALLVDLARAVLPEGFSIGRIRIPQIEVGVSNQPIPEWPTTAFFAIVGAIVMLEILAVILYLLWRRRERMEMEAMMSEVGEERSVVFDRPPRRPRPARPAPPPRLDRSDPVAAYVLALRVLAGDARWARHPSESPRAHAARIGTHSPAGVPFARLAAAYQLIRYAGIQVGAPERQRAAGRLDRVERAVR